MFMPGLYGGDFLSVMPSDITLEDFQCIGRRIFKASLKRCSEIQSPSTSLKDYYNDVEFYDGEPVILWDGKSAEKFFRIFEHEDALRLFDSHPSNSDRVFPFVNQINIVWYGTI